MLGRYSTLHLAGLGPNTALFNSVFQLFAFLGVTVANAVRSCSCLRIVMFFPSRRSRSSTVDGASMLTLRSPSLAFLTDK